MGSVSHAWVAPHHPDPRGEQLVRLAAMIRKAQAGGLPRQQEGWHETFKDWPPYKKLPEQFALFYDWTALCQKEKAADGSVLVERSADEEEAFGHALGCMQLWSALLPSPRPPTQLQPLPHTHEPVPTCTARAWPALIACRPFGVAGTCIRSCSLSWSPSCRRAAPRRRMGIAAGRRWSVCGRWSPR